MLFIKLPLVDEGQKPVGYLSTIYERDPKNIPRIGERIYLARDLSPKVVDISYSGPTFTWVTITLEPVPYSYRAFFEVKGKKPKHNSGWSFDDGTRYPLISEDTP